MQCYFVGPLLESHMRSVVDYIIMYDFVLHLRLPSMVTCDSGHQVNVWWIWSSGGSDHDHQVYLVIVDLVSKWICIYAVYSGSGNQVDLISKWI